MTDRLKSLTTPIGRSNRWFSFSSNPSPKLQSENEAQSLAACLPYEILQEIFQCCLPPNPLTTLQPNNTVAPLILCHICASWRIAAFGDHRLWKNLHVYLQPTCRGFPHHDIGVPREQVNMITWWTTRNVGGNYTFSFKFMHHSVVRTGRVGRKYVNYCEVFRVPAVRSARSLALGMQPGQWALLGGVRRPFPQLRSFSFSWTGDSMMSELKLPPTPVLRRLETSEPCPTFPWAQLTHLIALHDFRWFAWQELLESCANLQCAIFDVVHPAHKRVSKPIVHANLRQLVAQSRSFIPHDLLEGTLLPSLHSLRLTFIPVNPLRNPQSSPTPLSLSSLNTILRSTPSLKELHLHNCIWISKLHSRSHSLQTIDPLSLVSPRLEHLVIEKLRGSATNFPRNVAKFVQSRWICAKWANNLSSPSSSPSGSSRKPHQLHVEVILRDLGPILEHVRSAVEDFLHPNVQLTVRGVQEAHWEPLLSVGSKPGALENWEELVKFRMPIR